MSRTYETGLIITGDASGGLRALQATREEVDRLIERSNRAAAASNTFGRAQQGAAGAAQRAGSAVATATGRYGGLGREMTTVSQIDPFQASHGSLISSIPLVESATIGLSTYAKVAAGLFSIGRLTTIADDWGQVDSRIQMAVRSQRDYNEANERLTEISRRNYTEFEGIAELYMNSAAQLEGLGFDNTGALDFIDTVASGITITGANAQTSERLVKAFNDALALGAIRADQYNTLNLRGRPILLGLAEAMGVTEAELQRMARTGELTTDRWLMPFMSLMGEFQEKTESMPTTVRDASVVFGNALSRYVGEANKANGATTVLASGIETVADNIDLVVALAASAGAAKVTQMLVASGRAARDAALRAQEHAEAVKRQTLESQRHAATLAQKQQTLASFAAADLRRARAAEAAAVSTLRAAQADQQRAAATAALARGTQHQTAADLALGMANDRLAASQAAVTAAQQATTVATRQFATATAQSTVAVTAASGRNGIYAASLRVVQGAVSMTAGGVRALTTALGGPAGLIITAGSMIATWALFRTGTADAEHSISDLSTSIEDATRQLREMTAAQRESALLDISEQIGDQADEMERSLGRISYLVGTFGFGAGGFVELNRAIQEVKEGTRDASSLAEIARERFLIPNWVIDSVVRAAGAYDDAAKHMHGLQDRHQELMDTIDPTTGRVYALAAGIRASGQEWDRYIDRLQAARDTLGMTAEQEALYQAQRQGFNLFESQYAAAIAGQTEALRAYGQALAQGNQAEAVAHLERAERYAEQEAGWRMQAEAVAEMGRSFAEASRLVNATDSVLTATALSSAWAVARMNEEADSYLAAAQAVFRARAQAIRDNPGSVGGGQRRQSSSSGDRLADAYKRQADMLRQQIALQGEVGEAARVRYQIEHGELAKLSLAQQGKLIELAKAADRARLAEQARGMVEELDQRIALYGKTGEAARMAYQLERGELAKLTDETKALLRERARELDLLERRQALMTSYLPDQDALLRFAQGQAGIGDMLSGDSRFFAQRELDRQVKEFAQQGLPSVQGLDATVSGPFGEMERLARETAEYEQQYQRRLELLQAYAERRIEIEGTTEEESRAIVAASKQAIEALEENHRQVTEQAERQMAQARLAGYASMYGDMAGVIGAFAGEQSSLYRGMFAIAKGYAVAEAMMNVPKTYSNVYSSVSALPLIGPYLAPVMAAAAAAVQVGQATEIRGMNLAGIAHKGLTNVPREGTYLLDGEERVLAPQQNRDLTAYLARANAVASRDAGNAADGGGNAPSVIVKVIEDARRAGQRREYTDGNGNRVIEQVVANINNEGEVWQALSTKAGLRPRGD